MRVPLTQGGVQTNSRCPTDRSLSLSLFAWAAQNTRLWDGIGFRVKALERPVFGPPPRGRKPYFHGPTCSTSSHFPRHRCTKCLSHGTDDSTDGSADVLLLGSPRRRGARVSTDRQVRGVVRVVRVAPTARRQNRPMPLTDFSPKRFTCEGFLLL